MDAANIKGRVALTARRLHIDVSNFHLLHYRHLDGFLITGKNSGTHFLKYMLGNAIAVHHGLPPPTHASGPGSNDFVGHPKRPRLYGVIPWIGSSHNLPSAMLAWGPIYQALAPPPIVVLVRDIKAAMLSHYVKWRAERGYSLDDYLNMWPPRNKHIANIWWYIEFFNRWGRMAVNYPDNVLIVRYEDMAFAPRYWLERILKHYKIALSAASIDTAVCLCGRDAMRQRLDPNAGELIIPAEHERNAASFSKEDELRLLNILREQLKFSFGYGYVEGGIPIVAGPSSALDDRKDESQFNRMVV